MTDKKRKKTLLEIEFELLIQDLKNSGLKVNENHRANVTLVRKLNDRPKMKVRGIPPILFIGEKDGEYNIGEAESIIKDILNFLY